MRSATTLHQLQRERLGAGAKRGGHYCTIFSAGGHENRPQCIHRPPPSKPADLHKPDLLQNIYLGLFNYIMQGVEGFLKSHKPQQAFDDAGKEIPPYPGFNVLKNANWEVTQLHGKEMYNLSRCISAILASTLQNPDNSQHDNFQNALKCISTLVDFSLMAQYRSHTPDTLS